MNEKKRISGLGIAGSIINIIFAIVVIITSIIILFVYLRNTTNGIRYIFNNVEMIIPIFILILFIIFGILSIVKNDKLLSGNTEKKVSAIIFGLLTFSLLGSLFLIFSKVVIKVDKVKIKMIEKEVDYNDIINGLLKYKSLLDSDVITEDEFKTIKNKILKF